jgi:hypothetical protein
MTKIPDRIQIALGLAAAVIAVAVASHLLGQPHDLTLVAFLVSCCLLGVDWLMSPRRRK